MLYRQKIFTISLFLLLAIFMPWQIQAKETNYVNDKVEISNFNFTALNQYGRPSKEIDPQNGGMFTFSIDFKFASAIKERDKFTVQYDEKISITGISENVYPLSLLDNEGEVIAVGTFDAKLNSSIFTFTDYIEKHDNVHAHMEAGAMVDLKKVPHDANELAFTIKAANVEKSLIVDIKYAKYFEQRGNASLGSSFIKHNDITQEVTSLHYINVNKQSIDKAKLYLFNNHNDRAMGDYDNDLNLTNIKSSYFTRKSAINLTEESTQITFYEIPESYELPKSYGLSEADYTQFKNVTADFVPVYSQDARSKVNIVQIDLSDKLKNGMRYVAKVKTTIGDEADSALAAEMICHGEAKTNIVANYIGMSLYSGRSTGDGLNTTYLEINKVDEDNNQSIKGASFRLRSKQKHYYGYDYDDIKTDSVETNFNGLMFTNLKSGQYILEELLQPDGYKKPVNGNRKELEIKIEDAKLVLYIDGTKLEQNIATISNKAAKPYIELEKPFRNLKVKKIWQDETGAELTAPTVTVKVELYKNGTATGKIVELNAANNWTNEFKQLEVAENLGDTNYFKYTVKELGEDKQTVKIGETWYKVAYTGDMKEGYTITNKAAKPYIELEKPFRNLKVKKIWQDETAAELTAPTVTVKVELYKNGTATGKIVELNAANNWTNEFKQLEVAENLGDTNYFKYTVKELGEDKQAIKIGENNYKVSYTGTMTSGFNICNQLLRPNLPPTPIVPDDEIASVELPIIKLHKIKANKAVITKTGEQVATEAWASISIFAALALYLKNKKQGTKLVTI